MAPLLGARTSLSKERFPVYFGNLRPQIYSDSNASLASLTASVAEEDQLKDAHIRTIAWNPLGTLVATGAVNNVLRVWNPEKPNVRFSTELKGHSASVTKVAFNPVKDAELCSVSEDGTARVWDVRTKACVNEVKNLGIANALTWQPDGKSFVVGNTSGKLFDLSPTQKTPISVHQQPTGTGQVSFCWSGEKIFVPTVEGNVRILSYPSFEPTFRLPYAARDQDPDEFILKGHSSSCLTAEMSPTGRYLATGGADSIISLFDTKDWICQRTITRREEMLGPVRSISFTFDGSFVVGGCAEAKSLEVTHVETGEAVHTFKTAGPSDAVAWAPTRYCLAYNERKVLRIVGVDLR